ncbi:MAG TPA: sigma-70 region 4 domain-containing protein, partial [Actinoplanes sp.]
YLLDRSVAEIAVETGASTGTVKSWLSRGRAGLAATLGTLEPDPTLEATAPEGAGHAR